METVNNKTYRALYRIPLYRIPESFMAARNMKFCPSEMIQHQVEAIIISSACLKPPKPLAEGIRLLVLPSRFKKNPFTKLFKMYSSQCVW